MSNNAYSGSYRQWVRRYLAAEICLLIIRDILPIRLLMDLVCPAWTYTALHGAGLALLAAGFFADRSFWKVPHIKPLLGTLLLMAVTTLLHISYDPLNSARTIGLQAVLMLLAYPFGCHADEETRKEALRHLYLLTAPLYTLSAIASFLLYFGRAGGTLNKADVSCYFGFARGELFGIFYMHLPSALMCGLLLLAALYCFSRNLNNSELQGCKRLILMQTGDALTILILLLFLILSGCRTAMAGTAAGFAAMLFTCLRKRFKNKKITARAPGVSALLLTLLILALIIALCAAVYSKAEAAGKQLELHCLEETDGREISGWTVNVIEDDGPEAAGAENNTSSDISTGRFQIWKDCLKVAFRDVKTALFGLSPGGYNPIIFEQHQDLYIVSHIREAYPEQYSRGEVYHAHNSYLQMLCEVGILGVAVFAVFLIPLCIALCRTVFVNTEAAGSLLACGIVISLMVSACFDAVLFFVWREQTLCFWITAGMCVGASSVKNPDTRP